MDIREFKAAVKRYKAALGAVKGKVILVELELENFGAFVSLAPLSRAAHELGADLTVFVHQGKSETLRVAREFWRIYGEMKSGRKSSETSALTEFVKAVNKNAKSRDFERVIKPPEIQLYGQAGGFGGDAALCHETAWFKWRLRGKLFETCRAILKEGYALGKHEVMSIGFDIVPKKPELPLRDCLDNFAIAYAMGTTAAKMCRGIYMGGMTGRASKLTPMVRVDDLIATLRGCEYEKGINEPVFRGFRKLSKALRTDKLGISDASFGIAGEGYGGKHFFGISVGYPTPNKKARWVSPAQMFMKASWHSQTALDPRPPLTRYAITETLPIENFVRTCNIDYAEMRARNAQITRVIDSCEKLYVRGTKVKGGATELELSLHKPGDGHINAIGSDSDVRWKLNRKALKELGIRAGMYDNFPGGESFLTPYRINGTAVGDTVINIDRSYMLSKSRPLVVRFADGRYRIASGPRHILKKIASEKRDSRKLIAMYRRNRSLSAKQIAIYERNFNRTGEFAINTNPNARLGRYLIENEKIAKMIHIALGSGFDAGRETVYHWDFVINTMRQKADIYGVDKRGRKHWIIRKGSFVV